MHLLPHRHHDDEPGRHGNGGAGDDLTSADYDAQVDLALPTAHHEVAPGDVGGSVVEQPDAGAYDMDRDVGS